ncbi:formylglycine-generating enzyme family protein, partial [Myxococcota bacterium]|nr:formylglycine-generating enzyme family protein [Myxococcota bacterium]
GFLDPGEACDGSQMTATTCDELGYYDQQGVLTCRSDCTFDLSVCTGGRCGDGNLQAGEGEQCDVENLDEMSCSTLGLGDGTLSCKDTCRFDISLCELAVECGDDVAASPYETCDGTDLDDQTCESQGFHRGDLACNAECTEFDTSGCTNCGNGDVDDGETCDGANLDGQTCVTQGFGSGTLACNDGCTGFVTTGCSMNYLSPNIGTMIYVPAGTFQRDATSTNLSVVSAFRLSEHEITRAQWTAVTGWADPSNVTYSSGTSDPVQMVNWYDAIAFCNKLSILEGLTPVYAVSGVDFAALTYAQIPASSNTPWNEATANWAADGYRLPTEMEWMWAAMGADTAAPGLTNTTGYAKAFAGSTGTNVIDDYAWYTTNSGGKSHPVGTRLENELGFHDLSGNIYEWAWDWYAAYATGTQTDYRGPGAGAGRVARGGNWYGAASNCSVADRYYGNPYSRNYYIGFRVVRP